MHPIAFTLLASLLAAVDGGVTGWRPASDEDEARADEAPPPAKTAVEPRLPARAYATKQKPRAGRTQKWTRPRRGFSPRWESDYPEYHFSRFLDLARPTFHPPKVRTLTESEWQTALFRFAFAVVADLHDAIPIACAQDRCAPALAQAAQRLASYVRARDRAFTPLARTSSRDRFSTWYGWRLTGGTASFELGCSDIMEAPEVICRLELDLDDDLVLGYAPKNSMTGPEPDLTLWQKGDERKQALGEIQFDRTYAGAPVVIISGNARAPGSDP